MTLLWAPRTWPSRKRRLHSLPNRASSRRFPAGCDGIAPGYAHFHPGSWTRPGPGQRQAIGGSHMPLYETVLIARNDVTQQQVEQIAEDIGVELEADGGAVKKGEYW